MHLLKMLVVIMGESVVDGEVVGRNCLTAAKSAVPLMAAVWGKYIHRLVFPSASWIDCFSLSLKMAVRVFKLLTTTL